MLPLFLGFWSAASVAQDFAGKFDQLANECASQGEDDATLVFAECLLETGQNGLALILLQRVASKQSPDARVSKMLARAEKSLGLDHDSQGGQLASANGVDSLFLQGWFAIEAGKDSNINSATSRESIEIPLLNYRNLALLPLLMQHPSSFAGANGGIKANYSIAPTWEVSFFGAASFRLNSQEIYYFPHNYLASVALEKRLGPVALNIELKAAQHWVAKFAALKKESVGVGADIALTDSITASAAVDVGKNQYPLFGNVQAEDNGWSVGIRERWSGLALQLGGRRERSIGLIRDLDRDYSGLTLSWSRQFNDFGRLTVAASAGRSEFTEFSQLFNTYRVDQTKGLSVALDYSLSKDWHLTPRVVHERNDSNLPLVTFSRNQWMVELRREY